jgi:ADP-heptose:LPS heptosyltransferase
MLCAVPALRSLRAALPDAEIDLIGLPWARAFVARFRRYLDGFVEFPGFPGLPERRLTVGRFPGFLGFVQARKYDLALQLHGSGSFVNPLTVLFGARLCAGFFTPGDYCPDAERFLLYPDHGLEIRRLLSLVRFLGGPDAGEGLEFPLFDDDFSRLRAINVAGALRPREYACLHPGASVPERRWPAARFATVARALAARGLRVVLTGSASERPLTAAVAAESGGRCLDLAGQTDLGSLGALLSEARLIVCNDTGVAHLAVAVGLPGVIVSTGRNPERWAPTDRERYPVLCRDTGVSEGEVLERVDDLIDTTPARVA